MSFFDRSFGSPIGSLKNGLKNGTSTAQLIEKSFAPQNNKIDVLLINPPSSISERYGKENMGEVGGDLIPLGMASLAAYIREKGYGVGVLDCPTLRINNEKVELPPPMDFSNLYHS